MHTFFGFDGPLYSCNNDDSLSRGEFGWAENQRALRQQAEKHRWCYEVRVLCSEVVPGLAATAS